MFKKILTAFASILFSVSVFAQYGTWAYNSTTRQWVPPGVQINQNGSTYGSAFGGQMIGQQSLPISSNISQMGTVVGSGLGNGLTECQMVGGIVGGTIGSLAKNHTSQAVILGAIGGGLVGNAFCKNQQGERVLVQQGQNGTALVRSPSGDSHYCTVNGRTIEVAPRQSCLALDDAIRSTKTQPPTAQPQGQTGSTNAAFWGWHHPHASAGNKMICFATKQISGMPPQCSGVKVEPANRDETELQWRDRVGRVS